MSVQTSGKGGPVGQRGAESEGGGRMAGHDVDHRSASVLQDLVLVVDSKPDVDTHEVERSIRQLRTVTVGVLPF
jgi:hypothetical protein